MEVMSTLSGLSYSEFDQLLFSFCKDSTKEEFSRTLLKAGLKESDYNCIDQMDKFIISKMRTGVRNVTKAIVGFYCDQYANERTAKYFQSHILCQIGEDSYLNLIKKINELISNDGSIEVDQANKFSDYSKAARDLIKSAMAIGDKNREERTAKATKKNEALEAMSKYLAEVFVYCIQHKNKPKEVLSLPLHNLMSQNTQFTGRKEILQELSQNFWEGSHIQILSGMPGVGKTQIALQFAYQNIHEYSVIWWINAESEATMLESCNAFLCCKNISNSDYTAPKFCDCFNQCEDYWLLIYDNVDFSSAKRKQMLDNYIPKNRKKGNILITSRCRNDFYGISPIDVGAFALHEAICFIRDNLEKSQIKGDKYLARRLGFLPLALSYAVAYIKQTPSCNCSDYLKKLSNKGVKLFEVSDDIGLDYYRKTVRATFMISIEEFEEKSKNGDKFMSAVLEFIYATAYFPPNNIDLNLITMFCDNFSTTLNEILHDSSLCDKLVRILISRSLFYVVATSAAEYRHEYNDQILGMHRLFQEILMNEMPPIFPKEWDTIYAPFPHKSRITPWSPKTITGETTYFTSEDILSLLPLLYQKIQLLRLNPGAMKNTIRIIENIENFFANMKDGQIIIPLTFLIERGYDLLNMDLSTHIKGLQGYSRHLLYLYLDFLRLIIRIILLNDGHLVGLRNLDEYNEESTSAIIDTYSSLFFSLSTPDHATEQEFDDNKGNFRIYIQEILAREGLTITNGLLANIRESTNSIHDVNKNDETGEI